MASIVNDTLASMGRKGDTLIAHINPREAAILKAFGGKGGINPQTGFLEFWDADSDATADAAAEAEANAAAEAAAEGGQFAGIGGDFGGGFDFGGEHSFGNLDVSMGPQDPGYYSGATGMPGETVIPSGSFTGGVQIGKTVEGLESDIGGYLKAAALGFGVAGPMGLLLGPAARGIYQGITGGWSSLSPAEQDEAIATVNEAMPDRGGDGGGDYGITIAPEATFSATGTQPSGRRTIINNLTNRFNRGVTRTL